MQDSKTSKSEFIAKWAKTINEKFDLPEQDVLNLFTSDDTHNSDERTRENWKYGASVGISGTPMYLVNGVKLTDFFEDADAWKKFLDSLLPSSKQDDKFMQ